MSLKTSSQVAPTVWNCEIRSAPSTAQNHHKTGSKVRSIASITSTTSSHFDRTIMHPKQAEILSILSSGVELSVTQLANEITMSTRGKDADIARYHLMSLASHGYVESAGTPGRVTYSITADGAIALKAYRRESYVMPQIVQSPKINKMAGIYVPTKPYYRNNGNSHIPSRGFPC